MFETVPRCWELTHELVVTGRDCPAIHGIWHSTPFSVSRDDGNAISLEMRIRFFSLSFSRRCPSVEELELMWFWL